MRPHQRLGGARGGELPAARLRAAVLRHRCAARSEGCHNTSNTMMPMMAATRAAAPTMMRSCCLLLAAAGLQVAAAGKTIVSARPAQNTFAPLGLCGAHA